MALAVKIKERFRLKFKSLQEIPPDVSTNILK